MQLVAQKKKKKKKTICVRYPYFGWGKFTNLYFFANTPKALFLQTF